MILHQRVTEQREIFNCSNRVSNVGHDISSRGMTLKTSVAGRAPYGPMLHLQRGDNIIKTKQRTFMKKANASDNNQ